jgi:hypothetical protein
MYSDLVGYPAPPRGGVFLVPEDLTGSSIYDYISSYRAAIPVLGFFGTSFRSLVGSLTIAVSAFEMNLT